MTVSGYEQLLDDFTAGEINNSSLSDYKYLMNDYFQTEKKFGSKTEILELIELPAEIANFKLEEFGSLFF
jgi:glycosidase